MSSSRPIDALFEAARDEWSDPRSAAIGACRALLDLTDGPWSAEGRDAVRVLRQKRRDSALLLAVSEAAMWDEPGRAALNLKSVLSQLEDTSWAHTVAAALRRGPKTVHVLSLGEPTLLVMDELSRMADELPLVHAHHAAVARGLGFLDMAITTGKPEQADTLLLPVAAAHGDRIWSTARFIEIASAFTGTTIPLHHPLAVMSPLSRQQFRPPAAIVSAKINRKSR